MECRVAYPDPVGSGALPGSGFQISLDPVSAQILEQKKEYRKVSKSDLSEENLNIMTKDRQKMKRQQFLFKTHHKIDGKPGNK